MCHYNYIQSLKSQICLILSMFVEVNISLQRKSLDEIRKLSNSTIINNLLKYFTDVNTLGSQCVHSIM